MKWQTSSIGQLYECGESTVVYFDPVSGDTHLISDFAAHIIQQLALVPGFLNTEEIITLIADDVDPEDLLALRPALPGILNELADLDIVASD